MLTGDVILNIHLLIKNCIPYMEMNLIFKKYRLCVHIHVFFFFIYIGTEILTVIFLYLKYKKLRHGRTLP